MSEKKTLKSKGPSGEKPRSPWEKRGRERKKKCRDTGKYKRESRRKFLESVEIKSTVTQVRYNLRQKDNIRLTKQGVLSIRF